jgi:hypothetical protein
MDEVAEIVRKLLGAKAELASAKADRRAAEVALDTAHERMNQAALSVAEYERLLVERAVEVFV